MVFAYPIYEQTGVIDPALGSVILQVVHVIFTAFSSYLLIKMGRKTLLV